MTDGKLFIAGEWIETAETAAVRDKYSGREIGRVGIADRELTERAVGAARTAFASEEIAPYRRYEILMAAARGLEAREQELLETIVGETGFTLKDARNDFARSLQTITQAAEEAKRIVGEMVPIQGAPCGFRLASSAPSRRLTRRSTPFCTRSRPPSRRAMQWFSSPPPTPR